MGKMSKTRRLAVKLDKARRKLKEAEAQYRKTRAEFDALFEKIRQEDKDAK